MIDQDDKFLKAMDKFDTLVSKVDQLERLILELRAPPGPFGINMGDDLILVQSIYNVKYFIPSKDDVMTPQLIIYRQWEGEVSNVICSLLHKDSVFIDVGANFGYFTCLAGVKIGRGGAGRVYAFEANPKMFDLLRRNTGINWGMAPVDTIGIAVSNEPAQLEMSVYADHYANASLGAVNAQDNVHRFQVKAEPLDTLMDGVGKVDLIKIDVEGWEYRVLQGAQRIIDGNHDIIIVMEWSPSQMVDAGINAADLVELMAGKQFLFYSIELKKEVSGEELLSLDYGNILMKRSPYQFA